MKHKPQIRLEIKEISAEGSFEGILSPYGNVDSGCDAVLPGAYTKTLKEQGTERPLLWQHQPGTPIGQLTLEDRPDGLWCKGQLLMALPEAQKAYLLIKNRIVKGLSIGFESVKDAVEGGVRKLKEIKLYEGSIVTFPMNEMALITSVKGKGETKDDFNEELAEIQIMDARYQMMQALSAALSSLIWMDATREEKISLSAIVLQQFADAWSSFLPDYLDTLTELYGDMETWSQKRIETKAGKKISAATKESMMTACAQIKGGHDAIYALAQEEADEEATSKAKPAAPITSPKQAAETKSEPVMDHSALFESLKSWESAISAL